MTTDTGLLHFVRDFTLPPDQLWHLLTDAKMRELWGAPSEGHTLTVVDTDFSVGGLERHHCGAEGVEEFEVATRWYRIEAPRDAVFTETVEIEGAPIATSLVTYRITPDGGGTQLSVSVAVSSFVGPEAPDEFEQGWQAGLENLQRLAASHG